MGVLDGLVYAAALQGPGAPTGEMYAIDSATGEIIQRFRTPSGRQIGATALLDGRVYAQSELDGLYALDARTLSEQWHVDTPTSFTALAIAGDVLYMTTESGLLGAYRLADGEHLWDVPMAGGAVSMPVVSGGRIFVADGVGSLLSFGATEAPASIAPATAQPTTGSAFELVDTWDATAIDGLDHPSFMDVGPDGNLYVVNALKDEVIVLDPDGAIVRRWGQGGSTDGAFNFLRDPSDWYSAIGGVAVAPDGTVYVADTVNHRVQKFSSTGEFLMSWGSYGEGDGQFLDPIDVAVGPDGTVNVVDDVRSVVQRFSPDGKYLRTIGRPGSGDGEMANTGAVHVSSDGTLYNADWDNHRIQAFDAAGNFLWTMGSEGSGPGEFRHPVDVAVDRDGRIYAVDGVRLQAFSPAREVLGDWHAPFASDGRDQLLSVVAAPDGSIYAGNTYGDRIFKLRLTE
jgi:DNA-binding beta-propeller fold protein YncE